MSTCFSPFPTSKRKLFDFCLPQCVLDYQKVLLLPWWEGRCERVNLALKYSELHILFILKHRKHIYA